MNAIETGARPGALERLAGLGGVLYVILFVTGTLLVFSGEPDSDAPPAKVIAYFRDSGHRDRVNFGWLAAILGVFFLIWFIAGLRQLLRRFDASGFLTNVATIGGAIYAACTTVGFSVLAGIKTMSDDTYRHQVFPELIHAANDAGYVVHAAGGVGAGAMVIATGVAARRAGRIPGWALALSIFAGICAIASIFFFTQLVLALWILIAGVLVFRAGPWVPPAGAGPGPAVRTPA